MQQVCNRQRCAGLVEVDSSDEASYIHRRSIQEDGAHFHSFMGQCCFHIRTMLPQVVAVGKIASSPCMVSTDPLTMSLSDLLTL